MKKIGIETLWGGLFGIIAITAALVEMASNGLMSGSVAGAIKDISGTMVTVMVLLFAVRNLLPRKEKLSLEDKLKSALTAWEKSNSTLIVKSADDINDKYGFNMRTDVRDFYRAVPLTKNAGWFVRLPAIQSSNYEKNEIQIDFHLNKGTFFDGIPLSPDELNHNFDQLNGLFCDFINKKYSSFLSASGEKANITVKTNQPIQTDADIHLLVDVLNSMLQAYLVSAKVKV
jgi:hypothetical protein